MELSGDGPQLFFFFKQKTAYELGLGIPAEPLFRSVPFGAVVYSVFNINVLPQLDINNTIDHRPEGDEKWFLENEKTVRSEERRVGKECRSRWWAYDKKKNSRRRRPTASSESVWYRT